MITIKKKITRKQKKTNSTTSSRKATALKFLKYGLIAGLTLVITAVLAGGSLFVYYVSSAPKLSESKLSSTNSSLIYDSSGNLIADLGSEKRESVTADNIPLNLVNAITSIEDKRFFKHRGIDVYRILGAAFNNFTSSSTQGGSTLDQQLIKLAYFSTSESDQTLKRKAQEAWLALQMERKYTKEEILTFYVNKVYMGNGNYGMLTAAKSYYGKDLKDLSIAQLALLAGIPQAPSQYDPYTNPDAAQSRRDTVLAEMYENGNITKDEYDTAVATPVTDGLQTLTETSSYDAYLDNYIKEVIEEVSDKTGQDIYSAGLKVYTNVDTDVQQYLWNVYNTDYYVSYPDPDLQVASTIIDVTNGNVIAQLGSRNQDTTVSLGTNQSVLTDRDWGSTMKPITDYAPAIENGIYTSTAATTSDSKYYWPGTSTQIYNWDRQYYGTMTIQTAIQQSRNVPAVKALEAVGLDAAKEFLEGLGIYYPQLYYSNAISSSTSDSDEKYGASSEKMAAAYAAFSNGGIYYEPQYINKIEFNDGTTQTYSSSGTRAMKETTAYMMTSMLKTVLTYGTGTKAAISGVYQAGKTGTSNYSDDELEEIEESTGIYNSVVGTMAPDELFVGYTTQYSMAVWTGYKDRMTPIYGVGLNVAADVYKTMQSYLNEKYGSGSEDFTVPSGVYTSGGYVYLSGSNNNYTYSSTSSSVYSNIYGSSSSSSEKESSTAESSSEDSSSTESSNEADNNSDNSNTESSDE
ncbi:penicillin-binding protein PBP1A [Streptococcus macedonicus]|uniref:Multimodular transpeptidase-transglycosylase /Penicillin-binding protein 1A/1B (PBP1) n=1 Tax=Streptococcus gallolyticus TaxID=315405 RepID=A0A380K3K9_9STRE|nr:MULTISPECIES: penicillin-binding protein PBP1A [Streptococcus]ALT81376.1 penicillin-binding protein [Streptococcus gallolyticus]MCW8518813.1 penicillin-binding protein PBP1A [Streptococcus macedonicus]MCW8520605.1 penicillin-binding protein PBP1A [Streptococcus macedonicus]WGK79698.1 penicillin-binding protein PBP1A [Streptococcus macedonicus]SCA88976.1 Multimodular transpeptidase-transglycosylase / Penicillin-binding protein 1A/1B (PBP1) [Streptococcus macedonicus]